jgi:hypothetical protein
LEAYKATHIAVGHTVQKGGRIRPRFGNRVFLMDTGMLSSYYPGGRASALGICGDAKIIAEYTDQQVVILPANTPSPANSDAASPVPVANTVKNSEGPAVLPPGGSICAGPASAAR